MFDKTDEYFDGFDNEDLDNEHFDSSDDEYIISEEVGIEYISLQRDENTKYTPGLLLTAVDIRGELISFGLSISGLREFLVNLRDAEEVLMQMLVDPES